MTIITRPNAPNESTIIVHTRRRREIPNTQSREFTFFEEHQDRELAIRFPNVIVRAPLNPIYNCHGLVFASRRTAISDDVSIKYILEDDEYVEIGANDVLPGDVVLYFWSTDSKEERACGGGADRIGLSCEAKPERTTHGPTALSTLVW